MVRLLTIFASLVTAAINVILGRLVRVFSSMEKHKTYSKFHLSVAFKLWLALFFNTGMIPFFANIRSSDWFDSSGLVQDVVYKTLAVGFFSPFSYFIHPGCIINSCKFRREARKGEDSKLNQGQANSLAEGPTLDMAQRYANMLNLVSIAFFYFPCMPYMPLLCAVAILYQYWIEKCMLIRVHRRPEMMGATVALFYSHMMPYLVVLYGVANYMWVAVLRGENEVGGITAITAALYIILPIRSLLEKCSEDTERDDSKRYKDVKLMFPSDYDRQNPVTEKEATVAYLKDLAGDNEDE